MSQDTWRKLITEDMEEYGETWADLVSLTLTDSELDTIFDAQEYAMQGKPFTAWSKRRVYFPVVYDGKEFVASVSRHPDGIPTKHISVV